MPRWAARVAAQDEPGIGDGVNVVEDHAHPVEAVRRSHLKSAFLVRSNVVFANHILPGQRAFFASIRASSSPDHRWIQAKCLLRTGGGRNFPAPPSSNPAVLSSLCAAGAAENVAAADALKAHMETTMICR